MNKRIFILISAVIAVGIVVAGVLYARETGKLEDALAEIVTLEGNASTLESNISALESDLAAAEARVLTFEADLADAKARVSALEVEIAAAEAEEENGIPGSTLADLQLQNDVLAIIMILERAHAPDCTNSEVINSEVTENMTTDGTWGERWTLDSCGIAVAYDIRFAPNDIGGIFSSVIRVEAPTPTLLEQVTFPDTNLEAAIREAINKPKGSIYTFDLESLTVLQAWERGISDLTGLEYCLKLQWLELANNNISDISSLAGLTNLYWLNLGGNNISDISALAGLTNLQELLLEDNNINDISPLVANSGLSARDNVNLRGNPLSAISANVYIPQLEVRGVTVVY